MMFCSNQKFLVNGDSEEMLRATLKFALEASGNANRKTPQPSAYSVDPIRGVILYWHDGVKGTTPIPVEMRNEESVFALIKNYLNSSATHDRYTHLKSLTPGGDSWYKNGWECYIPVSEIQDNQMGLPFDRVEYAIVGFRPAITCYDK